MSEKLIGLLDRVLLPALLLIAGVALVALGERDLGIALLGIAVGLPAPQTASGLLGRGK